MPKVKRPERKGIKRTVSDAEAYMLPTHIAVVMQEVHAMNIDWKTFRLTIEPEIIEDPQPFPRQVGLVINASWVER